MKIRLFIMAVIIGVGIFSRMCFAGPMFYITYESYPRGATLIENGTNKELGITPVKVAYPLTRRDFRRGSIRTYGVVAYWRDGRMRTTGSLVSNIGRGMVHVRYVIIAPEPRKFRRQHWGRYNRAYDKARQEYLSALEERNLAWRRLEKIRGRIPFYGHGKHKRNKGDELDLLLEIFTGIVAGDEIRDAEIDIERAERRLRLAKDKLDAFR